MIIKLNRKKLPDIGDKRLKKIFFLFKIHKNNLILFHTMYKKQVFKLFDSYISESDYNIAKRSYENGTAGNGTKNIINEARWFTLDILTPEEAFLEEL